MSYFEDIGLLTSEDGLKKFAEERINFYNTFKDSIPPWDISDLIKNLTNFDVIRESENLEESLTNEYDRDSKDIKYFQRVQKSINYLCPTEEERISNKQLGGIWISATLKIVAA